MSTCVPINVTTKCMLIFFFMSCWIRVMSFSKGYGNKRVHVCVRAYHKGRPRVSGDCAAGLCCPRRQPTAPSAGSGQTVEDYGQPAAPTAAAKTPTTVPKSCSWDTQRKKGVGGGGDTWPLCIKGLNFMILLVQFWAGKQQQRFHQPSSFYKSHFCLQCFYRYTMTSFLWMMDRRVCQV